MSKTTSSASVEQSKSNIPEGAMTLKNFRASSDIDGFYRFINDNRVRREAKMMLEMVVKALTPPKRRRRSKKVVH
jgi:hypothetical protein